MVPTTTPQPGARRRLVLVLLLLAALVSLSPSIPGQEFRPLATGLPPLAQLTPPLAEGSPVPIGNGRLFGTVGRDGAVRHLRRPTLASAAGEFHTDLRIAGHTLTAESPQVARVVGRPIAVTAAQSAGIRWHTTTFADAEEPVLWRAVTVTNDAGAAVDLTLRVTVTSPAATATWDFDLTTGPAPTSIYLRVGGADLPPRADAAAFTAAATAVDDAWTNLTADALAVECGECDAVEHLVANSICDLLVQQDRSGDLRPRTDNRPPSPRDTAEAVVGLLRLGLWQPAARALAVWGPDASAEHRPSRLWLVLAHYWYARASDDLTLARSHWGLLEAAVKHVNTGPDGLPVDGDAEQAAVYAMAVQAIAGLRAMFAAEAEAAAAPSSHHEAQAAAWLRHFGRRCPAVDHSLLAHPPGCTAPWLGYFAQGDRHGVLRAAAVSATPLDRCGPRALARRLVALTQDRHPDRSATWWRLVTAAAAPGGWSGIAEPLDPAAIGVCVDALVCGLVGTRTTCWGPIPPQVLPLSVFLPAGIPWFRARHVARDRWRVHVVAHAEQRTLTADERRLLGSHPELGGAAEGQRHKLMRATVHLASEDPPAGAWQASVEMLGTSFQRYLNRESPVDELELWRPVCRAPWPLNVSAAEASAAPRDIGPPR